MATSAIEYENHLHDTEARWFAVYAPFRKEKFIQRLLTKKGIEAYVPIQNLTRRYTRKVKTVEMPLINCYVFVHIKKADYVRVLETEEVLGFVKIGRNLLSVKEDEIALLKRIVGESIILSIEPNCYQVGDRVEIVTGNLAGVVGVLTEIKGKKTMVVELKSLQYAIHIEVPNTNLKRVL